MTWQVSQLPVFNDNYIYIIHNKKNALVVDPANSEPVLNFVEKHHLNILAILNTHHHHDHVGGNLDIVHRFECPIYCSPYDFNRIPGATNAISEGEQLVFEDLRFSVIDLPGHTLGHIGYRECSKKWLFSGDTLFSMGCGRLFEGTPEQMFNSLKKISTLPADTLIFCSHEYTLDNIRFTLSLDPQNEVINNKLKAVLKMRQHNLPTVPTTIGEESKSNLFLRCCNEDIVDLLDLELNEQIVRPVDVFAHIRKLKDNW